MKNPKGYWTFDKCKLEALNHKKKSSFKTKSKGAYKACLTNNWLDLVCSHMISRSEAHSLSRTIWTFKKCKTEAAIYTNRNDFRINSSGAYQACLTNNWLNLVCSHMTSSFKVRSISKTFWTLEKCKLERLKHKDRSSFRKKSRPAYQACVRKKWLHIVCKNKKINSNYCQHEKNNSQPIVLSFFKKNGLTVEKEFYLSKHSKVDFLCTNKNNRKFNIEVKSDKQQHSFKKIQSQISKYKTEGKKKFGNAYAGTFLVSPKGRYGYSLPELKAVLKQKGLI